LVTSGFNSLGWGLSYRADEFRNLYLLTIIFLLIGSIVKLGPNRNNITKGDLPEKPVVNIYFFFTLISISFVLKCINLGGVPLFGGVSRYGESSGFFDFFLSGYILIGLLAFQTFLKNRFLKDFIVYLACLSYPLLLSNRQDTTYIILGSAVILFLYERKVSARSFFALFFGVVVAVFAVVQIALIRFGEQVGFSSIFSIRTLDLIRAEVQAPYFLGNYAVAGLDARLLGRYSISDYFWFLFPAEERGASFVNSRFVGVSTAQSVGFPFGYVLDFGWVGAFAMCFLAGILGNFLFQRARRLDLNGSALVVYILFILNSLWSLRSGVFPFSLRFIFWMIFAEALKSKDSKFHNVWGFLVTGLFGFSSVHLFYS
jgi:oligosaccharide repeat unit polymerase